MKIENILPISNNYFYPLCVDGKLSCPPEDCGGIGGYYDILNILKDKKHPEYAQFREWLGVDDFDAEFFDINGVNDQLYSIYYDGNEDDDI